MPNGDDYSSGGYVTDDTGYSGQMSPQAAATYPPNQLITPPVQPVQPTPTQTASLSPTPPPGPIEDWHYDSGVGRWIKNITPPSASATASTAAPGPGTSALQPSTVPAASVQPTRFDMTYGDSLSTMQSTNRIDPRMANNRIWGVEGPQYGKHSLPIGQSPNDIWTTNEVGAPPSRIADRAEYQIAQNPDFFKVDANGKPINNIFAGIGSNVPSQLDDVGRFIDAVKKSNPNARIVIPGMGPGVPTPNVDAANAALKQMVESHGGIFFQPNLPSGYVDGVHPRNSKEMFDQANTVLSNAAPPTPRVSATGTGTIPGEAPPQPGLPQPGQQPQRNALQPGATQPQGAAGPIAPINMPANLAPLVNYWADYYGLDRNVFARMIGHESGFVTNIRGSSGEIGLGQLMPDTAVHVGVKDRTDPSENLRGSAQYLREMLDNPRAGGDYRKALQLYNHGPGSKTAFNDFSYADAVLTGRISEGGGYALPPDTNKLMPGGQNQAPGGPAASKPGATGTSPQDVIAQINAQNDKMRRLALYQQVAQALKGGPKLDPRLLESGYDPGQIVRGALQPVDRPAVNIRDTTTLGMPGVRAPMGIGEPMRLPVSEVARPGYAQLLQRRGRIEGI